jgi:hypothetical protein
MHSKRSQLTQSNPLLQDDAVVQFAFAHSPRSSQRGFAFGYFWFSYFSGFNGASSSCAGGRGMSG